MNKYFLLFAFALMSQFVTSQINNEGLVYVGTEYQVSFKSNFVNDAGAEFWNNGDVHASKDWTNDGTVDFNVLSIDSGKTNFVGDDAQTISGTNNSNFTMLFLIIVLLQHQQ